LKIRHNNYRLPNINPFKLSSPISGLEINGDMPIMPEMQQTCGSIVITSIKYNRVYVLETEILVQVKI